MAISRPNITFHQAAANNINHTEQCGEYDRSDLTNQHRAQPSDLVNWLDEN